ncbi:MAG: hypothetical protein WCI04_00855 [archaeon]
MIDLKAEITPFRMVLAHREPLQLMVEMTNNSNKAQMVSLEISGGNYLAFDKGGRMRIITKKIESFNPGETIRDYYNVYPAANADRGIETITVLLAEHYNNSYQYIQSKKVKEISLRID